MSSASEYSNCFHCGLPSEHKLSALVDGKALPCCCLGCKSIVESIYGLGLSDFYQLRKVDATALEEGSNVALQRQSSFSKFDDPAYFREESEAILSAWLYLSNIHCVACVWLIESSLKKLPGIKHLEINLSEKQLYLRWERDAHTLSEIIEHLAKLGYLAKPVSYDDQDYQQQDDNRSFLKKLVLSGFGAGQVMMLSLALYIGESKGLNPEYQQFILWVCALVTTPVLFFSGQTFFFSAFRALRQKYLNMDVPIAIALSLAYVVSIKNTWLNVNPVYFDTICMLIFFLSLSRYFELWVGLKSRFSFRLSTDKIAQHYTCIKNGNEHKVLASDLNKDDQLLLKEGEFLPVDALIIDGTSTVNESVVTGEFSAIKKQQGDTLYAGTCNGDATLRVRVLASASESSLGLIEDLAKRAQLTPFSEKDLIQKVSRWFILVVLFGSTLNILYWYINNPDRIIETTLAMLIVSCPCALALAIPLTRTNAKYQLMKMGLLPLSPDLLQKMSGITDVVFDKTGTLTQGEFELINMAISSDCHFSSEDLLSIASTLEQQSNHPIASAFKASKQFHSTDGLVKTYVGDGVEASINGTLYRLGELDFVNKLGDFSDNNIVQKNGDRKSIYLSSEHALLARFDLDDQLKADFKSVIDLLKERGLQLHVLSGDVAEQLNKLKPYISEQNLKWQQSPEKKLEYIETLKNNGKHVMTIGDGNNDAPFVASGNMGIAMAKGAQLTQSNADALLLSNFLMPVYHLFQINQNTDKKITRNLIWAFCYNISVLPLASMGYIPPYIAAAGMSLSSLIVVLNSSIWNVGKNSLTGLTTRSYDKQKNYNTRLTKSTI